MAGTKDDTSQGPKTLPLEDSTDLLILLLYAPGRTGQLCEPIVGTTRLQKEFFLLQQGKGPAEMVEYAEAMGYSPDKMGPFSTQLRDTVAELESADIIQAEELSYMIRDDRDPSEEEEDDEESSGKKVTSYRYKLTDFGIRIGEALWNGISREQQDGLTKFKSFFNSISLRQLLIFTYENFRDYTTRSTIKDHLGF